MKDAVKIFQPKGKFGQFQQFRMAKATPFYCSRCERDKKSKMITIVDGNDDKKLCNGCTGLLLSTE